MSIVGVLSNDPPVARWAASIGAPSLRHDDDPAGQVGRIAPDYLLSIFNLVILSPAVIDAARIAAINYHDALLPRYAGLHATSWAIIRREPTHGITWHLMEPGIDTGAILRQERIDVTSADTSLSLNLKCSAAAIRGLEAMIPDLQSGSLPAQPQNLELRTYYPGSKRPDADGVIDWNRTAEDIDALIRACDFGSYRNPLVMPKILLGDGSLIVSRSALSARPADHAPGVLLHVDEQSWTVSTASGPIELGGLMTADGEPLGGREALQRSGLTTGDQLRAVTGTESGAWTAVAESLYRHENYWERRLEALAPVSPCRGNRAISPPDASQRLRWEIPTAVDAWVERHGSRWSREEFLMAACGAFLARLTFSEIFDVELLRTTDRIDGPSAAFAAAVPFRFTVGADFLTVLDNVRAELDRVSRRRTYPRDLVPRSPRLRDQRGLRREAKLPVAVILGEPAGDTADWDVAIGVPDRGGYGVIDVRPALAEQLPAVAQWLSRFVEQLADTDGALESVGLAGPEESDRLSGWGSAPAVATEKDCLHRLFESQVLRTPDAVAVSSGTGELTYRELDSAANGLAAELRLRGVGPEVGVGICLHRSPALIVGLLGILKAGGYYVPLDPALPAKRLEFAIDDARLEAVVTGRAHADRIARATPVFVDEIDTGAAGADVPCVEADVSGHCAAYVIYTSGSTGRPKGVQVEHHSVVNFVRAAVAHYRLTPADRVLQFASMGFDTSVEEIFPTLTAGATLVIRDEDMLGSARSFLGRCAQSRITVLDLPTAYWHTLVTQLRCGAASLWPELRMVIIGGEAADSSALADWFASTAGSVALINTYGPSEATVVSTWATLTAAESRCTTVPIGVPVPGASVEVLDRFGQPLPVGVPGQLHIGGAGVARGYLNHPELTREAFVVRPDPGGDPARVFRTGDLCMWRADGMLEFLGRIDDQVKVRGHRVELREIEVALEAHPDIASAAVVVSDGVRPDAGAVLRAVVVPRTAGVVEIAALRAALRDQLPDWMIPGQWVVVDEMPLSTNGKVDRRALAAQIPAGPTYESERSGVDDEPASTLLESAVADIWRELFHREHVRRDDNFFDLGGHSLLAVRFVEELERRLGHSLPITVLFEHPTVESLTRALAEQTWIPAWTTLVPLNPKGTRPPLFMIHGLVGEVFGFRNLVNLLDPDQPVYGVQTAMEADGTLIHSDLAGMADHYVSEIRACQPTGPYFVSGYSLGGWFAYEVATLLRSAGEQVCLIVIDTHPYCVTPWPARGAYVALRVVNIMVHIPMHVRTIMRQGWSTAIPYLTHKARPLIRNLSRPTLAGELPRAQRPTMTDDAAISPDDNYLVAVAALHSIQAIDCDVELVLAETTGGKAIQAIKAVFWRLLVRGDLRVHRIRTAHGVLLTDEQLAGTVNQILTSRQVPPGQPILPTRSGRRKRRLGR